MAESALKMLNPTLGNIVTGAKIDDFRFSGRMVAAQLFQVAPDPRETEDPRRVALSKELQDLVAVRKEVQRLFQGAKAKNVPSYAKYIVDLANGADGITPPIILYTKDKLEVAEDENGGFALMIPFGTSLVAIDGETQLAARFDAASIDEKTKKMFVSVELCHGRPSTWARQAFHDLNVLGIRPTVALSVGMDGRDPITQITRDVENRVPFFTGRVNKVRRQLGRKEPDVVTISALRGACLTVAEGIKGVQYGSRSVPLDPTRLPVIRTVAIDWFTAVTTALGSEIEGREDSVAGSGAVLAAIGAIGHDLLPIADPAQRLRRATELASGLRAVNWSRGRHWEGIAGKFTPRGTFSQGGTKETAYAVFAALTDPENEGYARVRQARVAAA